MNSGGIGHSPLRSGRGRMVVRRWFAVAVLLGSFGLVACGSESPGGSATDESTEALPPVSSGAAGRLLAEGAVEPERWVDLSFAIPGTVVTVNVVEGQLVQPGEILAELDALDAGVAVQQAEAALALAQARLALVEAGARPEQIDVLEAQLATAETGVEQAAAQLAELTAGTISADIKDAQIGVIHADVAAQQAVDMHERTLKCVTVSLPDGTERTICPALGPYEEMARYQMNAAAAALQAAQATLDVTEQSVNSQIRAARAVQEAAIAQRDAVRSQLDLAVAGSRPENVAAARAAVQQAEAALARARAAVADAVLTAPFASTVVEVAVDPGESVVPGMPSVTLATLDRMRVRTTDLTEMDVVKVAVGQPATLKLDALPDQLRPGHVARIEQQSIPRFGDVTYSVLVDLDEPTSDTWRWGMTAWVEVEVE